MKNCSTPKTGRGKWIKISKTNYGLNDNGTHSIILLGGMALFEEVCHWIRVLRVQILKPGLVLLFLLPSHSNVVPHVDNRLYLGAYKPAPVKCFPL